MTLNEFVRQNRTMIDYVIVNTPSADSTDITDDVRKSWVVDDTKLFELAIDEGVLLD